MVSVSDGDACTCQRLTSRGEGMKRIYVNVVAAIRSVLRTTGLLAVMDLWARHTRVGTWARSLLSIYDMKDLVALDTPWWTFRSADMVAAHLRQRPEALVFEWGSGASTVWLAKRAATVIAVEHDAEWAEQVRPMLGANARVDTVVPTQAVPGGGIRSSKPGNEELDFTAYVKAIDEHPGPFDLIVVDGRAREACLQRALPKLAAGGLLVFDNVDRVRYRKAIEAEEGIEVAITRGLTPSLPYPTRTALITRTPRT
jgi:hypothetical protein